MTVVIAQQDIIGGQTAGMVADGGFVLQTDGTVQLQAVQRNGPARPARHPFGGAHTARALGR
jgi:hypothetical protein